MHVGLTTDARISVLVADPQPVFRLGLVALLTSAYRDWDVTETDTLDEHRVRLLAGSIDLLIVEGRLLGLELANAAAGHPRVNLARYIIAVTEPGDSVGALGCLAAGAHATIARSDPTSRMLETIRSLTFHDHEANTTQPPTMVSASLKTLNLTSRQLDVLRLLAKGQSNKVIARDLGLSVSTVKVHLHTVFRALGASNRLEALVRARPFQASMVSQDH
jgi:DNA-binding NarL/FixJ family response regulator